MYTPWSNQIKMPCPNGCHCGRSPKAFACQVHCGIKIRSSLPCMSAFSKSTIMLIRQVSQRFQMKPHPHSIECRQQFLCAVVVQSHELIPSTPAAKCPSPAAFVSDTTLPHKKNINYFWAGFDLQCQTTFERLIPAPQHTWLTDPLLQARDIGGGCQDQAWTRYIQTMDEAAAMFEILEDGKSPTWRCFHDICVIHCHTKKWNFTICNTIWDYETNASSCILLLFQGIAIDDALACFAWNRFW